MASGKPGKCVLFSGLPCMCPAESQGFHDYERNRRMDIVATSSAICCLSSFSQYMSSPRETVVYLILQSNQWTLSRQTPRPNHGLQQSNFLKARPGASCSTSTFQAEGRVLAAPVFAVAFPPDLTSINSTETQKRPSHCKTRLARQGVWRISSGKFQPLC